MRSDKRETIFFSVLVWFCSCLTILSWVIPKSNSVLPLDHRVLNPTKFSCIPQFSTNIFKKIQCFLLPISFAALPRIAEIAQYRHRDVAKLRKACSTGRFARDPGTRNWTQLWFTGKFWCLSWSLMYIYSIHEGNAAKYIPIIDSNHLTRQMVCSVTLGWKLSNNSVAG